MKYRLGQFFAFIGLITLLVFCATDQAHNPVYGLFCWGFIVLFGGLFFMWRGYTPPQPSGRFSRINKFREEGKRKRVNKEEKKY